MNKEIHRRQFIGTMAGSGFLAASGSALEAKAESLELAAPPPASVGDRQRVAVREVRLERLRPREIEQSMQACPVLFQPLGTIEWHGLHNPVGLDGMKAHAVVNYLSEHLGGVVMPPLFWGDHRGNICELVFDPAVSAWLPPGTADHVTGICGFLGIPRERLAKVCRR